MAGYRLIVLIGISALSLHPSSGLSDGPATLRIDPSAKTSKLVTNFIPAAMHVLHHCIESIQYEPTTTSTSMASTTSTTTKPMTTSTAAPQRPTILHKPGYFGPEKPPTTSASFVGNPFESTPSTSSSSSLGQTTQPSTETAETLLWNDKQFFEWFLQSKYKQIKLDNDFNLQLLAPLPRRLLHDIMAERYELPAFLDKDNVNEFRNIFDDQLRNKKDQLEWIDNFVSYSTPLPGDARRSTIGVTITGRMGGRKRVPPTKPYIHMLMLYDMLKREAKKNMFEIYEGYSAEILSELAQHKAENGQQQLLFVLSRMLEEQNIEKADVVSRTKAMITELENPNSAITGALVQVPPLVFTP
ncbi:uncharacterized protein LOC129756325 [Uranotaenia lowii]|uniref:uncharacterized protein LOC129756325 n=1 Tax=Uranotaenia lowii TaxID=190385 RepID=UPI002478E398|nr:uncharacterized protein LOC129756325 [Uranotaenia lowii]